MAWLAILAFNFCVDCRFEPRRTLADLEILLDPHGGLAGSGRFQELSHGQSWAPSAATAKKDCGLVTSCGLGLIPLAERFNIVVSLR